MKRWKKGVLLTFGVLLLLLFAVSRSYLTPDPIPGVTFSVEEGSVTAEGMTFTITNDTDAELTYGAEYRLEKRGLLGWRHLWENFLPAGWDAVGYFVSPYDSRTENFDYSTFVREAENMEFQQSSISVGTTVIDVQGTYEDEKGTAHSFTVSVPKTDENIQWLTDTLGEGRIAVTDPNRENQFMNIIVSLLPVLLMVGVFFIFFSKMNAGGNNKAFDFAKSRAKIQSNVKVRFKDVAGCDEEKEEVREIGRASCRERV